MLLNNGTPTHHRPDKIIFNIIEGLFGAESGRIQKWIDQLSNKDQKLRNATETNGFIYDGRLYTPSWVPKGYWEKGSLNHTLHDEGASLAASVKIMNDDKLQIRQALFILISNCEELQDVRDALPECVIQYAHDHIKHLSRTRAEGYTIVDNPRKKRQFEAILPKIEVYSVANLIY